MEMTIWQFMDKHLTFSFFLISFSIFILSYLIAEIITQTLRHWNIHKHGYPPKHCDSDGDFKSN